METKPTTKRFNIKKKDVIPLLIFAGILLILVISSNLTGRLPVIESLNKKAALPGEEVIIFGNYFGNERRNSKILISGKSPPTTYYQEQGWSNKKISFIIPEDMKSGLVSVVTDRGESKELVLLLNKTDIPGKAEGPSKPGEPYITEIIPAKGTTGSLITLTGLNFGQDRAASNIYFTWISEDKSTKDDKDIFSTLIPALEYDYDFVNWSDREIQVRIPDGSSPGPLLISTDKGISSPLYLEVQEPIGKKRYTSKRTYQVTFSIKIENINAETGNGLYIWLPRILNAPEQRGIKVIHSDPAPRLDDYKGLMQYYFEELRPGEKYNARVSYLFYRYAVSTTISNPYVINYKYDNSKNYLGQYTHANNYIPSTDSLIIKKGKEVLRKITNQYTRNNPYFVAKEIYNHVINSLEFENNRFFTPGNILSILKNETPAGNSLDFAAYFCALARSLNIPARPVGGFLINKNKVSTSFFWAEFYIENLGWIPVDPVLGAGIKPFPVEVEDNPREFYFGSLDNRHIALSKGVVDIKQMSPRGRTITSMKTPSIQGIYEESTGKLHSYSTTWSSLEDIGIY